jgi:hypothetical protein
MSLAEMRTSNNLAKDSQGALHPTSGTQALSEHAAEPLVAKTTSDHLAIYLGLSTARAAVRACALRTFGREPETLELEDAPQLMAALRPMLGTLLGRSTCQILLHRIERTLASS